MMKPKLFSIIKHRDKELSKKQITEDIISGVIVAIIALPLSVALGISSGVTPEKGLITAIIAGFLISFLGGSRVQIGGPTGAFVVIVYGIIKQYGLQGLTIATIMAGLILVVFGLLKFGSVIKFIPYPITTGFTAGIAVTLFSTQIKDLLGLQIEEVPSEFIEKWASFISHIGTFQLETVLVGLISILIIVLWPKVNKTIPGSLIALLVVTAGVKLLNLPVETIGSRFGEISRNISLIDFTTYDISLKTLTELMRPALTIAFLAGIESLLSAVVADGMIGKKHNSNMELIAQGIANIGSALFGGIPATGAIARTAANVKNGGRTPIAGVVHALVLLLIMILFMPLAKLIPMATLGAILVVVAYNMSEWRSFKGLLKSTKSDVAVLLITFTLTVVFDLVIAIEVGMVFAMMLFVKRMSDSTQVTQVDSYYTKLMNEDDEFDTDNSNQPNLHHELESDILLYEINGPLFFGVANTFLDVMNELKSNSSILILEMKDAPVMDATAYNSLKRIDKRCREKHILLLYAGLKEQPMKLLTNVGYVDQIGKDRFFNETEDALAVAREIVSLKRNKKRTGLSH